MRLIFTMLFPLLMAGCQSGERTVYTEKPLSQQPMPKDGNEDHVIQTRENAAAKTQSSPGVLLQKIEFKVKTDDKKNFEDGFIPWIEISKANDEIKKLAHADEIILIDHAVSIVIDYPLTNEYTFELHSQTGFTRAQFVRAVAENYRKIYAEEEKTATVKTQPMEKRTMMNRNQTNGKYGVWGHDIEDLALSGIRVYRSSDGKILLQLDIES